MKKWVYRIHWSNNNGVIVPDGCIYSSQKKAVLRGLEEVIKTAGIHFTIETLELK